MSFWRLRSCGWIAYWGFSPEWTFRTLAVPWSLSLPICLGHHHPHCPVTTFIPTCISYTPFRAPSFPPTASFDSKGYPVCCSLTRQILALTEGWCQSPEAQVRVIRYSSTVQAAGIMAARSNKRIVHSWYFSDTPNARRLHQSIYTFVCFRHDYVTLGSNPRKPSSQTCWIMVTRNCTLCIQWTARTHLLDNGNT